MWLMLISVHMHTCTCSYIMDITVCTHIHMYTTLSLPLYPGWVREYSLMYTVYLIIRSHSPPIHTCTHAHIHTEAAEKAENLFQGVLKCKTRADATRNALMVLQRYRFLFNLPRSIEKNITNV